MRLDFFTKWFLSRRARTILLMIVYTPLRSSIYSSVIPPLTTLPSRSGAGLGNEGTGDKLVQGTLDDEVRETHNHHERRDVISNLLNKRFCWYIFMVTNIFSLQQANTMNKIESAARKKHRHHMVGLVSLCLVFVLLNPFAKQCLILHIEAYDDGICSSYNRTCSVSVKQSVNLCVAQSGAERRNAECPSVISTENQRIIIT